MFLEVFKTGNHTDSNGNSCDYTTDSLEKIAGNYRLKLRDNPESEAPIVIGHPKSTDDAKGWVKKLFRRGNSLIADVEILDKEFADSLRAKVYRNVSIALDSNLNFIHLGFLGAVPPAADGLKPMKYSAISDFKMYDEDIAELKFDQDLSRLEQENANYRNSIEQYESKLRIIEFSSYVDSIFSETGVKYFSKEQSDSMVSLLEMAHKLDSYSGGDANSNEVKSIIKDLAKMGRIHEFSKHLGPNLPKNFSSTNLVPDRNLIHLKAIGLMQDNPELSYEEALNFNQ